MSIASIIIGILVAIFSTSIVTFLSYIIGTILLILAANNTYVYAFMSLYRSKKNLMYILLELAIGIVLILHTELVIAVYPLVIAFLLLVYAVNILSTASEKNMLGFNTTIDRVYGIAILVMSAILLIIPSNISAPIIGYIAGGILIIFGIWNIITTIKHKTQKNNKNNDDIIIEVE